MTDVVKLADAGHVRTITLNRPEKKNALSNTLAWGLIAAPNIGIAREGLMTGLLTGVGAQIRYSNTIVSIDQSDRLSKSRFLGRNPEHAAHAFPPQFAQGAAMAVEDGVALTELLSTSADIDLALRSYRAEKATTGEQGSSGRSPSRRIAGDGRPVTP